MMIDTTSSSWRNDSSHSSWINSASWSGSSESSEGGYEIDDDDDDEDEGGCRCCCAEVALGNGMDMVDEAWSSAFTFRDGELPLNEVCSMGFSSSH